MSIRIRELRHRPLSEELLLYYNRVMSAIEGGRGDNALMGGSNVAEFDDNVGISLVLRVLRCDCGLQELVPFLCWYVASGLMSWSRIFEAAL